MSSATMLEAALKMASMGYSVFPLKAGTKAPKTLNGYLDATTNPEQITAWFANEDCNLGIACIGEQVAIDQDQNDGKNGIASWRQICDDHGITTLPDGRLDERQIAVRTPRGEPDGGVHLYLIQRPNERVGCTQGANKTGLATGIDTRGQSATGAGGYVVAPPSTIPEGCYSWIVAPWDRDAIRPVMPEFVVKILEERKERQGSEDEAKPNPEPQTANNGKWQSDSPHSTIIMGLPCANHAKGLIDSQVTKVRDAAKNYRHDALLTAAKTLGGLLSASWSGCTDLRSTFENLLTEAAQHCFGSEYASRKSEVARTIKDGLDHGMKRPILDRDKAGFDSFTYSQEDHSFFEPPKPKPRARTKKFWRLITTAEIEQVIDGTCIAPLVRLLKIPMNPTLPLELTLPKAMALIGCALSGRAEKTGDLYTFEDRGVNLARLKIHTGGGQVCNGYYCPAALTGKGKDIMHIVPQLAAAHGWLCSTGGSAEGIADVLSDSSEAVKRHKGAALLVIGEFAKYLDSTGWQSNAATFLTEVFSQGFFDITLSQRTSKFTRNSTYCYPSIIANVQPATLQRKAGLGQIDQGFLPRFAFTLVPESYDGIPITSHSDTYRHLWIRANQALECYKAKKGDVYVPENYHGAMLDLRKRLKAAQAPLEFHWSRLWSEYGPRWAAMLSVMESEIDRFTLPNCLGDDDPEKSRVVITERAWEGAATLVQWYFRQGEELLSSVCEDATDAKFERLCTKLFDFIKRNGPCLLSSISHHCSRGNNAESRKKALYELLERGMIETSQNYYRVNPEYEE